MTNSGPADRMLSWEQANWTIMSHPLQQARPNL